MSKKKISKTKKVQKKVKESTASLKQTSCQDCIFTVRSAVPEMLYCKRHGEYLHNLRHKGILSGSNTFCSKYSPKVS